VLTGYQPKCLNKVEKIDRDIETFSALARISRRFMKSDSLFAKSDVPQNGWLCCNMEDLGKPIHICEMCGKEGVRYVHVMEHAECSEQLRVGCVCAEKMENDAINPKQRETKMKSRSRRLSAFLERDWRVMQNGNLTTWYKDTRITIMRCKFRNDRFGIALDDEFVWKQNSLGIGSIEAAKAVAFDLMEERRNKPHSPRKNGSHRQNSELQTTPPPTYSSPYSSPSFRESEAALARQRVVAYFDHIEKHRAAMEDSEN
jgi:hypothetical protein